MLHSLSPRTLVLPPIILLTVSINFMLRYYHIYTFSFLSTVNCSDPTVPRNGSIEPYQNTTEGAEILFRCNPGFVPAERMRTLCRADGRWNPDPFTLVCICELKMISEWICMDGILIILFSELWNSLFCWSCGCRAI